MIPGIVGRVREQTVYLEPIFLDFIFLCIKFQIRTNFNIEIIRALGYIETLLSVFP